MLDPKATLAECANPAFSNWISKQNPLAVATVETWREVERAWTVGGFGVA
jgi:hypothetical protein